MEAWFHSIAFLLPPIAFGTGSDRSAKSGNLGHELLPERELVVSSDENCLVRKIPSAPMSTSNARPIDHLYASLGV